VLSLRVLPHTRAQLSCVGFLHVNSDKLRLISSQEKLLGFIPRLGFPRVKSCVYCAWLSFYDSVVFVVVIFG